MGNKVPVRLEMDEDVIGGKPEISDGSEIEDKTILSAL